MKFYACVCVSATLAHYNPIYVHLRTLGLVLVLKGAAAFKVTFQLLPAAVSLVLATGPAIYTHIKSQAHTILCHPVAPLMCMCMCVFFPIKWSIIKEMKCAEY